MLCRAAVRSERIFLGRKCQFYTIQDATLNPDILDRRRPTLETIFSTLPTLLKQHQVYHHCLKKRYLPRRDTLAVWMGFEFPMQILVFILSTAKGSLEWM